MATHVMHLNWQEVTKDLPEGVYVVKTRTLHPHLNSNWVHGNVRMHYNEKGKQVWSVNNQKVTHYLKEI